MDSNLCVGSFGHRRKCAHAGVFLEGAHSCDGVDENFQPKKLRLLQVRILDFFGEDLSRSGCHPLERWDFHSPKQRFLLKHHVLLIQKELPNRQPGAFLSQRGTFVSLRLPQFFLVFAFKRRCHRGLCSQTPSCASV